MQLPAIDKEVRDLVDDAHETALKILRNNLPLLNQYHKKFLKKKLLKVKISNLYYLNQMLLEYQDNASLNDTTKGLEKISYQAQIYLEKNYYKYSI